MHTGFIHSYLAARYLIRAHIGPFFFSFSTLMFLFLLQFVMKFIDQLVGKGLTPFIIIELIALNLAWMVVLAVPMSVLVATLMAFGDLSSRNEITAFRAGGMSIYRMIAPVILLSGLVAVLLVLFNNYVLPEANHQAKSLAIDIRRKKPTLNLVAGLFSQDMPGYSILVRKTFETSNNLEGVTLYDHTDPNRNVVITAQTGAISFSQDYRKIIMNLQLGEIHELDMQQMSVYRRLHFQTHRIVMDVEGFGFERSAEGAFGRSDRELSAAAMVAIADSIDREQESILAHLRKNLATEIEHQLAGTENPLTPPYMRPVPGKPVTTALHRARVVSSSITNDLIRVDFMERQEDQYWVEIHKKYSIPAACLVFVLIGAPLGIMVRRGGFGIAASFSLGFFVLYWAFLIGGEKLADRALAPPALAMWAANILLALFGLILIVRVGKEAGAFNFPGLMRFLPRRFRKRLGVNETAL